jgi:hypothetical protein
MSLPSTQPSREDRSLIRKLRRVFARSFGWIKTDIWGPGTILWLKRSDGTSTQFAIPRIFILRSVIGNAAKIAAAAYYFDTRGAWSKHEVVSTACTIFGC